MSEAKVKFISLRVLLNYKLFVRFKFMKSLCDRTPCHKFCWNFTEYFNHFIYPLAKYRVRCICFHYENWKIYVVSGW